MKAKNWLALITLGVLWGSSFLWIKIALDEIGPFLLVAIRLVFGAVALLAMLTFRHPALPRDWRPWGVLALLGLTNTALPFVLITWGEQYIDSGLTAILNGTVPLFSLIIAHFALDDEHITLNRAGGLLVGFVGVIVLVGPTLGSGLRGRLLGQLAVLAAAFFYAVSSVIAKKGLKDVPPMVQAAATVAVADALAWGAALGVEGPLMLPALPLTWFALAWLGILGSCVAYLLYFYLIQQIGAARSTMVTYIIPVVGVALGVIFLGEQLSWALGLGATLVVSGIWIVNAKKQAQVAVAPSKP